MTRFLSALWLAMSLPAAASIITVPAGGDLQEALDRASPGDTILLARGATYTGNFILPAKTGDRVITVRTAGLTWPGTARVDPVRARDFAKLQSPSRQAALRTAAGAHHWRLQMLEVLSGPDVGGDLIQLGDGSNAQRDRASIPHDLTIDHCYVHGDPTRGQKRGIALNSAATTITASYIADIKGVGFDTQAIGGWNGPGPYTIENNYLEAAGENILFGGGDPAVPGLVVEDVTVRRNRLAKPESWRSANWTVKNLFELKNARRVLLEGNLIENVWAQAQSGYAIVLTPRNQDGACPWCTVEDVTIRGNLVRRAGGAINLLGTDDIHPSAITRRIRIEDNLFAEIDGRAWGGGGGFLLVGAGPSDVVIQHNTVWQTGNVLEAYGGTKDRPIPIQGFTFKDNLIFNNDYGVHGQDRASGLDTINTFFPAAVFTSNAIAGADCRQYPAGNQCLDRDAFTSQFVAPARGDYRLSPSSRFRGAASDGHDLGADVARLYINLGLRLP
jgi:hypothetical protein